jgi:2-oxoisovalerate dehydrogenase E2 component (dihydrolipoyl transacylase)
MSIDFILPDIGEGIVECELVEWLVKEGEIITEDQPIADVMTDKALVQIPAMHSGVVEKLYYQQGDIAKVHSALFAMTPEGELVNRKAEKVDCITNTVAKENDKSIPNNETLSIIKVAMPLTPNSTEKILASPAVRRVARELEVNIQQVKGSGKKGRVYKDDVLAYQVHSQQLSTRSNQHLHVSGGTRVEPIRSVKKLMASAMQESVSTIPHFTYCDEIDLTKLVHLRLALKADYAKQDIKLTMMPFFMKAMSLALKHYPIINSQVNTDCTELTYFNDHNIGMAVDAKVGLLVPNIKHVQTKSIINLAQDIMRLTDDTRSGRIAPEDLKGGTITISNIGAIGGKMATPIIHKPEAAIVALGKLQKLPRYNEQGDVKPRHIMQVSWSGDHRIIDGATIARFCNLWKSFLEKPSHMLVHMR